MYHKAGITAIWLLLLHGTVNITASPVAQTSMAPASASAQAPLASMESGIASIVGSVLNDAISVTSSSISSALAAASLFTLPYTVTEGGALSSLLLGKDPLTLSTSAGTPVFNPVSLCSVVSQSIPNPLQTLENLFSATPSRPTAMTGSQPTLATITASTQLPKETINGLNQQQENEVDSCAYPHVNGRPLFRDIQDRIVVKFTRDQELIARNISQSEHNGRILKRDSLVDGFVGIWIN